jgi:hypothetical protein
MIAMIILHELEDGIFFSITSENGNSNSSLPQDNEENTGTGQRFIP